MTEGIKKQDRFIGQAKHSFDIIFQHFRYYGDASDVYSEQTGIEIAAELLPNDKYGKRLQISRLLSNKDIELSTIDRVKECELNLARELITEHLSTAPNRFGTK